MADDRQRVRILQTQRHARRGAQSGRITRLLDRRHPQRRGVGLMRRTAAVWAGKATGALSRISRLGGGTTLPGDVARAIDPDVLRKLSHDLEQGAIVITGTNGKTTTARVISWLLEGAGQSVVSNRAGANLIYGATAAALQRAGANGRLRADWGVFEIDEASLERAVDEIQPRATIVLNLFRDQLDRYGELESIAKRIEKALARLPGESRAMDVSGTRIELPLGGLYNAYNLVAAFATATALGLDGAFIADRFRSFRAAFGRQERLDAKGRHLNLVLSKNPAGFNETLRTAIDLAGGHYFLIGLNDRRADGTDVSWIWDVDFEHLRGRAAVVVPAGNRAADLAVRLKYAAVNAAAPESDPGRALDAVIEATPEGETAHLLCTYTAMLDLRTELVRRGWAKPYWET